jgi:hypothetical protein
MTLGSAAVSVGVVDATCSTLVVTALARTVEVGGFVVVDGADTVGAVALSEVHPHARTSKTEVNPRTRTRI